MLVYTAKRFLSFVFMAMLAATALVSFSGSAVAATITWGTHTDPYEFGGRTTNWDQSIESESAAVTKVGSFSNFNVDGGATPWGSGTWLFSGYVEVAFTVPADTLFIQFQADTNDGIAEFIVDGISVGTLNTFNIGWFQVAISDLSSTAHTLRVNRLSADLAFDNFGATSTVPVPAAAWLFGSALLGLSMVKRRKA